MELVQDPEETLTEQEKASMDFLKKYYESPLVDTDTLAQRISKSVAPKEKEKAASAPGKLYEKTVSSIQKGKQLIHDMNEEGNAGDNLLDDIFEVDTDVFINKEKRKLSKRTRVSLFLLFVAIPLTILIGFYLMDQTTVGSLMDSLFGSRKYYFISLILVVYALLPFFMIFEGRRPQVRELVVLASLIALATAVRAVFFMVPSFKPMIAIVIIAGIAFGGESGFLVGSMSMLISNFMFGQGPWTPWQMFVMGIIGFLSGILFRVGFFPKKRLTLCIYGFVATVVIYGGIMNPASAFMGMSSVTVDMLAAVYISGFPMDVVHGLSTVLFLWIGAKPLLEKFDRLKVKYGLMY